MKTALEIINNPEFGDLLKRVKDVAEYWTGGLSQRNSGGIGGGNRPQGQGSRNGPQTLPDGVPEIPCRHGTRVYVSRANWRALFCAAPQDTPSDEKCPPMWWDKRTKQFVLQKD